MILGVWMFAKIAHRGASAYNTENTITSIKEAIYQKADMVEIDVRFTKDKIPILSHDPTLKRLAKKKIIIQNTSFKMLRSIKLKNNETMATLEEALDVAKGKIIMLLDVKARGIEGEIVAEIKCRDMEDQVLISSTDLVVLRRIKKLDPGLKTALIFKFLISSILRAKKMGCYSVHPNHMGTTAGMIRLAKRHGLKVHPFTVNNSKRMRQLIKMGVDGIITDKPVLLRNVLHGMDKHGSGPI